MLRNYMWMTLVLVALGSSSHLLAQAPPGGPDPEKYGGPASPPPVWGAVSEANQATDLLRFAVWEPRVETYTAEREVEENGKMVKKVFAYNRVRFVLADHYWPLSAITATTKAGLLTGDAAGKDLVGKTALFSNGGEPDPEYLAHLADATPYVSIHSPDMTVSPAEKLLREYLASLGAPIGRIIPNPNEKLAKYFPEHAFFAVQYPAYAADLLPAPLKPYNLAAVSPDGKVTILNKPADLIKLAKDAAKAGKDKGAPQESAPAEELLTASSNPPETPAYPSPADAQYAEKILKPEIVKLKLGKSFRPLRNPLLNIAFPGATFFPVTPAPSTTPSNTPANQKTFRERDVLVVDANGTTTLIQCEQGIGSYIRKNYDKSETDAEKRSTMRTFMALAQGKYPELTFGNLSTIKIANEGTQTTATCSAKVASGGSGSLSVILTFGPKGLLVLVRKPSVPVVKG